MTWLALGKIDDIWFHTGHQTRSPGLKLRVFDMPLNPDLHPSWDFLLDALGMSRG